MRYNDQNKQLQDTLNVISECCLKLLKIKQEECRVIKMEMNQAEHCFQTGQAVVYQGQLVKLLGVNLLKEEFTVVFPDGSKVSEVGVEELCNI